METDCTYVSPIHQLQLSHGALKGKQRNNFYEMDWEAVSLALSGKLYLAFLSVVQYRQFATGYLKLSDNLKNNAVRKKEKYMNVVKDRRSNYRCVKFVNLSVSSLGVFSYECSTFFNRNDE